MLRHYRASRTNGMRLRRHFFLYDCHMLMIDYRYKFSSSSPSHIQPFIDNLIDVYFEFYLIFALLDLRSGGESRKMCLRTAVDEATFFLCARIKIEICSSRFSLSAFARLEFLVQFTIILSSLLNFDGNKSQ